MFRGRQTPGFWVYVNSRNTRLLVANNTSLKKKKSLDFIHMEVNVISTLTEFLGPRDSQQDWRHDYPFNLTSEASCFLVSRYSWKILMRVALKAASLCSATSQPKADPCKAPSLGGGGAQVGVPSLCPQEHLPGRFFPSQVLSAPQLSACGKCAFIHVGCTLGWHLGELLAMDPAVRPCCTWGHHTGFFSFYCKRSFN